MVPISPAKPGSVFNRKARKQIRNINFMLSDVIYLGKAKVATELVERTDRLQYFFVLSHHRYLSNNRIEELPEMVFKDLTSVTML